MAETAEKMNGKSEEAKAESVVENKTDKSADKPSDVKTEDKTETSAETPTDNKTEDKTEKPTDEPMDTKTEDKTEPSEDVQTEAKTEKSDEAMDTQTEPAKDDKEVKKEEKEESTEQTTTQKKDSEQGTEAKKEVKTEDKTEPTDPALEKKIIKQVEYYFGDHNLGRDKFLQGVVKEDNGWVTLEVMLKFNRLRTLSDNASVVVAALEKSSSGLLEISEDKLKLRRNPSKPLPELDRSRRDALKTRSVYAKGFPVEYSLEDLEAFFEKQGAVEHIQLRRNPEKNFKGSVFVIFAAADDAKKFVEAESIKCQDAELTRFFKDTYFKHKQEERKSQKEENLQEAEENNQQKEEEDKESFRDRITKGSVLALSGLPDGLTLEDIRTTFSEYGEVAWVEYKKGDVDARVRYSNEDEANTALEKAKEGGELKIKDTEIKAQVLTGDEEIAFWKSLFQENKDRKKRSQQGKRPMRGGRGYGRGGPAHKKRRTH